MSKIPDVYQTGIKEVSTVFLEDSVKLVRKKMTEKDHVSRSIYVVDSNFKLVGVITLGELLKLISVQKGLSTGRGMPKGRLFTYISEETTAQDLMNPPISVKVSTCIGEALSIMVQNNIGELPVVDEQQIVIGEINAFEILGEMDKFN